MADNYVVYHLHTMLSNGVTNIDSVTDYHDYAEYAASLGMKAMAYSEHGSVFGWSKKKETVEGLGMKYIHAEEFYVTETLKEKVRDNYHCVLIARNYDGVKELNRLSSIAFNREDNHFYYAPRISFEELINTSDNIIICTACLASILASDNTSLKERFIGFLTKNKHRCFLEIQHHNVEAQKKYNKVLYALSKETGIPLIAGTDTHSLNEEHARGRSILQKSKKIFFDNEVGWNLIFMTYEELVAAYETQDALPMDVVLEAINNTNVMADMIEEFEIDRSYKYPHLWENPEQLLRDKIKQGILVKGVDKYPNYQEYLDRIEYEMEAYKHNEAIDFMLLMEDVISWCKSQDIQTGYGRGSVNGSVIAWLIGITEMDSIKFGLNFERFMNVERVSLSDIDTDFPPNRIDEVKEYVFNHHGLYCSDIVTFNTIADKGAIRDVGRALEIDLDTVGKICDAVDNEEKYQEVRKKYPELFKYVDLVKGCVVSVGNHPCFTKDALVLTDKGYETINNIKPGDKVFTHNNRYKEVKEVICTENNTDFYNIKTSFMDIKATANHPFLVRRPSKVRLRKYKDFIDTSIKTYDQPEWVKVENIRKGDMVGMPVNKNATIPNNEFSNDLNFSSNNFWWIVGRYIGDGWITHNTNRSTRYLVICCSHESKELSEILSKLQMEKYDYRVELRDTVYRIYIKNMKLLEYLERFGKYADGKYLTNDIIDLPIELLRSFIRGYISADGSYSKRDNAYAFNTVSKKLALGLSMCIAKAYMVHTTCQTIPTHTEKLLGRKVNCKEKYQCHFHLDKRQKDNNFYENGYVWFYCYGTEILNDIETTYNLSVYDDNSYTVNNAAVHNCGMIVSPHPIDDEIGLFTTSTDPFPVSQLYMKEVDSLNYVKLDLLKLDTIQLISETCKLANIPMALPDNLDLYDDKVWNSIRDDTTSIFQWESNTGQDYINKLLSDNTIMKFRKAGLDIDKMTLLSIGNSAIRPAGASYRNDLANGVVRTTGSKPIDEFLSNTFGYLVFQCQIIEFLHQYCGFTMGEADIVRRGFAKKTGTDQFIPIIKNGGYLNDNKNHYINGYIKTMEDEYGISAEKSEKDIVSFIQVIEDASSYLFSLNHSQPYSFMGYACGYLRYYYPTEFITCCLNINRDNSDKTTAVTEYAKKIGVQIVPIKFGHSRADYSCDAENRKIYKGVASIKNLNTIVSEELYKLSQQNVYDNFIDILLDITNKTSCNSRQLDILIKLDYFSDFGEANELLYLVDQFNKLYEKNKGFKKSIKEEKAGVLGDVLEQFCELHTPKKVREVNIDGIATAIQEPERQKKFWEIVEQCKKHKKTGEFNGYNYDKLFKLTEMPEDVKFRFATKISDGEFKGIDGYKVLTNLKYCGNIMSIREKIKYQQEFLSYIDYTDPSLDKSMIIVTNLNTNYSPKFVGYCLNNGKTCPFKVRKNKRGRDWNVINSFKDTPFEDGDMLQITKCKQEPKSKFIDGEWKHDYSDKEWWLYGYNVLKG